MSALCRTVNGIKFHPRPSVAVTLRRFLMEFFELVALRTCRH
jgi:hypothetical protein